MCLADLLMTLQPVEGAGRSAGGEQFAWVAICAEIDARRALMDKLTLEQQAELAELKSRWM